MSANTVDQTTGALSKVAGLYNSQKIDTMYNAYPEGASASNKLVSDATADEKISDESQVIFKAMGRNGAKNLLKSTLKTNTYDGLTFTVGADGSVTLSGTATSSCGVNGWGNFGAFSYPAGNYILSDGGAGSQASSKRMYYKINNGNSQGVVDSADITLVDGDLLMVWIYVDQGISGDGSVFYPMLRLASDTDSTYQPYAKTNQELTEAVQPIPVMLNDLGAKNIFNFLNFEAYNATVSVNGDALHIVTENKISANAYYTLNNLKKNTDYVLSMKIDYTSGVSGVYIGGSATESNFAEIVDNNYTEDTEVSFRFNTGNYNYIRISLFATRNTAMNGDTTFSEIMLRDASIADDSYVPYAMTNRELTEIWLKTKFLTV